MRAAVSIALLWAGILLAVSHGSFSIISDAAGHAVAQAGGAR
jgi:hypothetical protein